MTEIIAGVEVPETSAAADATRVIGTALTPLLFHHSCRVFLFGSLHARALGLDPDPELLYVASLFHDAGLQLPFSGVEQRFEIDGADDAKAFLLERGFAPRSIDTVWNAIALHTTPGIPERMGPEPAALSLGVLTDAVGVRLAELDPVAVDEIVRAHPRGGFKTGFLHAFEEGLRHRPDTTYGTMNADILEHFVPGFRRVSMVERILESPWPS